MDCYFHFGRGHTLHAQIIIFFEGTFLSEFGATNFCGEDRERTSCQSRQDGVDIVAGWGRVRMLTWGGPRSDHL